MAQVLMAASLMAMSMFSSSSASSDEADIRQLQAAQAEAWNRHDAKAYVRLFAADGDIVNVLVVEGRSANGEQVERGIRRAISRKPTHHYRYRREISVADDCHCTCPLDHGRREDAAGFAGTARGYPDPSAAEEGGTLADSEFPKHQWGARTSLSGGWNGSLTGESRLNSLYIGGRHG
jgi:ketosteroid isomerase-like protein